MSIDYTKNMSEKQEKKEKTTEESKYVYYMYDDKRLNDEFDRGYVVPYDKPVIVHEGMSPAYGELHCDKPVDDVVGMRLELKSSYEKNINDYAKKAEAVILSNVFMRALKQRGKMKDSGVVSLGIKVNKDVSVDGYANLSLQENMIQNIDNDKCNILLGYIGQKRKLAITTQDRPGHYEKSFKSLEDCVAWLQDKSIVKNNFTVVTKKEDYDGLFSNMIVDRKDTDGIWLSAVSDKLVNTCYNKSVTCVYTNWLENVTGCQSRIYVPTADVYDSRFTNGSINTHGRDIRLSSGDEEITVYNVDNVAVKKMKASEIKTLFDNSVNLLNERNIATSRQCIDVLDEVLDDEMSL